MNENNEIRKTITIRESTYDRLEKLGTKSETWDDVLNKLATVYEKGIRK